MRADFTAHCWRNGHSVPATSPDPKRSQAVPKLLPPLVTTTSEQRVRPLNASQKPGADTLLKLPIAKFEPP